MVSATTYTLVGVGNKFLTVILNIVVWDKHSSQTGLLAVVFCLVAGAFYEQSPRRSEEAKASHKPSQVDLTAINGNVGNSSPMTSIEAGHPIRRGSGTEGSQTPHTPYSPFASLWPRKV
jgi:hypothetical protein